MAASFEGLDLNLQSDRDRYYERVRLEFEAASDHEVSVATTAVIGRQVVLTRPRWSHLRDIAERRVELARRVEPPMEKFRKVRAGWYSIDIVSLDEALADWRAPEHERKVQETVDVSKEKHGDAWVVSTRGGRESRLPSHQLNQDSLFRSVQLSFADAKRYAVALKAYLTNKGPHPDWLDKVLSDERRVAFETMMTEKLGEPYADWQARMLKGGDR